MRTHPSKTLRRTNVIGTIGCALGIAAVVAYPAQAENFGVCHGVDNVQVELKHSYSSAYYLPGLRLIILNREILKDYSLPVKKFIFAHECAHADPAISSDEAAADCAAAERGVKEGWLGKTEIIQICAHLSRFPADANHKPIHARCANIRRCSKIDSVPDHGTRLARQQTK